MKLTFARLEQKDILFLSELLNDPAVVSSLHINVMDYAAWLDAYLTHWNNDTDEAHFIMFSKKTPVGWLKLNGLDSTDRDAAWISMLVVGKENQRRGAGHHAVAFSETFAKERGFCKLAIHTTCDNLAAIALYLSCGYKITKYGSCTTGDGKHRVGYTFMKDI